MLLKFFRRADGHAKYQSLDSDDSEVSLHMLDPQSKMSLEHGRTASCDTCSPRSIRSFRSCSVTLLYTVLTLVNLLLFSSTCGMLYLHYWPWFMSDTYHLKATSNYSPVFDALKMKLETQTMNGTLFPTSEAQIFRQLPSPEVDAAWEELSATPVFLVDRVDVERLGKDPQLLAKAPEKWEVGEKYFALLEGHHQMHCLNEIRKQAYSTYYYGPNGSAHPLHWVHLAHCLDMVRQSIMCTASVDLITSNWVETQPGAYPDFNVVHQCRNYEATLRWAHEQGDHILTEERRSDMLQPPEDAIVLPMEPGFYDYVPALREWYKEHPDPILEHATHD